jgi:hypothetical protein
MTFAMTARRAVAAGLAAALLPLAGVASAEEAASPTDQAGPPERAEPSAANKRKKYSLPWGLRPAIAPNLLRLDTVVAPSEDGTTVVSILTGGGKPIPAVQDLGFYVRGAAAQHAGEEGSASAVGNPLVAALFTPEVVPSLRVAAFGAVAAPVGQGGGDRPDPLVRATLASAGRARSGLDGVLFATNYLGMITGADVAYMIAGFTFQAEATLIGAVRARGSLADDDRSRTAITAGLHAGYLLLDWVNLSVEGRLQAWLSEAAPVRKDPAAREQASLAGGARFNVPLSETVLMRPGIAYEGGLDAPMADKAVHVVQVDLPVTF